MLDALRREFNLQLFADGGEGSNNPGGEGSSKGGDPNPGGGGNEDKGQTGQELKALEEQIKALRRENADHRTKNKVLASQIEKLTKLESGLKQALGIESDKGSPDDAMKAVAELRDELKNERMQNTFSKVAMKAGADVDLTWAFLKGSKKITPDMTEKDMEKVLKTTLEEYPKLKSEAPPRQSGGQFNQPGSGDKIDMNAAIRRMARR